MKYLFSVLYRLFFAFTLLVYALTFFAFSGHWAAGFLMMSLPALVAIHALFFVISLLSKRPHWLALMAIGFSFPFWARTFQVFASSDANEDAHNLTVLSYNTMGFDMLNYLENKNRQNALNILDWAKNTDADIKCFQEFYNRQKSETFNSIEQFQQAGYPYYATLRPPYSRSNNNFMGMVIFSKYPIIHSEYEVFGGDTNGALYADIVVKKDTIRVINVHLRSMIVRFGGVREAYQDKDYGQGKSEVRKIAGKLKRGFIHHEEEVHLLTDWIDQSPYPVLVCGDFNETPYSYSYGQMTKRLANAFETAGRGFGFTYQNMPKLIRIDQQFYDQKTFEVVDFQTLREVKYSDHYPIVGKYRMK
jgi:endonuclease/exonuclease/phosphatase (EEP) superfamily protein YafD